MIRTHVWDVEIGETDAQRPGKMRMNFLHANFEDFLVLQRIGAEDEAVGKRIGGARGGHLIRERHLLPADWVESMSEN